MGKALHASVRNLLAVVCLAAASSAGAIGLQVAPILLELAPGATADGLWLSNTGDAPLTAQVRVYHWTQRDGEEQLEPSRGLVISPPMLQLDAGARQLVRVIRTGPPPAAGAAEDAYRVVVNEVPAAATKGAGLKFVLRYSIPVFVAPADGDETKPTPQLGWTLRRAGERVVLDVRNDGRAHAQLSAVDFIGADGRGTTINAGLLGYALPGTRMQWTLDAPPAIFVDGGTLSLRINGEAVEQPVALVDSPR
jgi:fimbrial chaperone protein